MACPQITIKSGLDFRALVPVLPSGDTQYHNTNICFLDLRVISHHYEILETLEVFYTSLSVGLLYLFQKF